MLRALKRNAGKAKLNPAEFWLHKFRATFATTHLQAGIDLRTVMTWMGQTNLESIIRYLKPARNQAMIEKVNVSFANHKAMRPRQLSVEPGRIGSVQKEKRQDNTKSMIAAPSLEIPAQVLLL
ncbi:hypothetical protein GCM10011585_34230 [Edaphobacter dinghuensis]|uniref:Tyr recombinase domain-containing protein n=2 Tax=Edaphobacter dinghuensis TaxID=1560005 RepID=A0A917HQB7_9BACT|nr:hypothetical protein GCM10011585_34230 [Edaphobacter dinghuensis]